MSTQPAQSSKVMFWFGVIVSALPVLALTASATMKLTHADAIVTSMTKLGYPLSLLEIIASLELGCVILYLIPRTCVLGAILMTGYMGGATASHVRVGEPWYIPAAVGALAWIGLWLRDSRIRHLAPFRQ